MQTTNTTNGVNEMTANVKEYVNFKLKQWMNINGFDHKQENAKEILNSVVSKNLKPWISEAIAAGC